MPGMTVTKAHIRQARLYQANYSEVHGHIIPSVSGLSKVIRVKRNTLNNLLAPADPHRDPKQEALKEEMRAILIEINTEQELVLLQGGLDGTLNSNIVKLALGKHGYSEKHSQELTGEGGGPISGKWTVEFVDP